MNKNIFNTNLSRYKYMRRPTLRDDNIDEKITTYFNHLATCNYINDCVNNKNLECKNDFQNVEKLTNDECELLFINNIEPLNLVNYGQHIWLKQIISIVENLHLCISISSIKMNDEKFPLVYVNKEFEKTTEYNKHEILGKNCKFLQPTYKIEEEESRHILMSRCIHNGDPTSVIITNVKKSGDLFYNLLSFIPIYDNNNTYVFCVAVQCEITTEKKDVAEIEEIINTLKYIQSMELLL